MRETSSTSGSLRSRDERGPEATVKRPMLVELLWFSECPNHAAARAMLEEVIAEVAPGTAIRDIDASVADVAASTRFPGSPTVRVDGRDIDPVFTDPGDYTPRCRLYRTSTGLRGLPERDWIVTALRSSSEAS